MRIAVITDSNSGMSSEEAERLGVFVVPMPVVVDGETFYEGKNLTQEDFFKSLAEGKDITTSQPSPGDILNLWDSVFKKGYDEIVYIPMSSGLSNSYASAAMLAADYEGRVQVVDNHRISIPQRSSVEDALSLAEKGKSGAEIKKILEVAAYDASIYIAVDTLEYLKKGGRITPATAAIGSVLHIKPILSIQGDKLDACTKARGMKRCRVKLIEALKYDLIHRFSDGDMSKVRIGTAGTVLNPEQAEEWRREVSAAFPGYEVVYEDLGLSIATHTGPEAVAAGVYKVLE